MLEHDLKNIHISSDSSAEADKAKQLLKEIPKQNTDHSTPRDQSYVETTKVNTEQFMTKNNNNNNNNTNAYQMKPTPRGEQAKYTYAADDNFNDYSNTKKNNSSDYKYANYTYSSMVDPVISNRDVVESEQKLHYLAAEKNNNDLKETTDIPKTDFATSQHDTVDDDVEMSGANEFGGGTYKHDENFINDSNKGYISTAGRDVNIKERTSANDYDTNMSTEISDHHPHHHHPHHKNNFNNPYQYGTNINEDPRDHYDPGESRLESGDLKTDVKQDSTLKNTSQTKSTSNNDSNDKDTNRGVWSTISNYLGVGSNEEKEKADDSMGMPGGLNMENNDSSFAEEPQWHNMDQSQRRQMDARNNPKNYNSKNSKFGLAGGSETSGDANLGFISRFSGNSKMRSMSDSNNQTFDPQKYESTLACPAGGSPQENYNNAEYHHKHQNSGQGINADIDNTIFQGNENPDIHLGSTSNDKKNIFDVAGASGCAGLGYTLGPGSHKKQGGDITSDLITDSAPYRLVQNPQDAAHLKSEDPSNLKIKNKTHSGNVYVSDMKSSGDASHNQKQSMTESDNSGIRGTNKQQGSKLSESAYGTKPYSNDGYYAGTKTKDNRSGGNFNSAGMDTQNKGVSGMNTENMAYGNSLQRHQYGFAQTNDNNYNSIEEQHTQGDLNMTDAHMDESQFGDISALKNSNMNQNMQGNSEMVDQPKKFVRDHDGKVLHDKHNSADANVSHEESSNAENSTESSEKKSEKPLDKIKHMFGVDKKHKSNVEKKKHHEHGTFFGGSGGTSKESDTNMNKNSNSGFAGESQGMESAKFSNDVSQHGTQTNMDKTTQYDANVHESGMMGNKMDHSNYAFETVVNQGYQESTPRHPPSDLTDTGNKTGSDSQHMASDMHEQGKPRRRKSIIDTIKDVF